MLNAKYALTVSGTPKSTVTMEENRGPLFGSVLIARASVDAPNELEIKLRHNSLKLRVVSSLSGNAHYLFPAFGTSVAVRVYDVQRVVSLQEKLDQKYHTRMNDIKDDDFDGIKTFRDSFKHSIVFFSLPTELMNDQMGSLSSVVNQLQYNLGKVSPLPKVEEEKKEGCSRIFFVPEQNAILQTIAAVLDSLKVEKRALKEAYFKKEAERKFLPDPSSGSCMSEFHAGSHVACAFRAWVKRNNLSLGDANVVINVMGSLGNIITADKEALESIPIDPSTKSAMMEFFSSSKHPSRDKDIEAHNFVDHSRDFQFCQEEPYGECNEMGFDHEGSTQMDMLNSNAVGIKRPNPSEFRSSSPNMGDDLALSTYNFSHCEEPQKLFQNDCQQGVFTTRRTARSGDFFPSAGTGQNINTSMMSKMPPHKTIHEQQYSNGYDHRGPCEYQYS